MADIAKVAAVLALSSQCGSMLGMSDGTWKAPPMRRVKPVSNPNIAYVEGRKRPSKRRLRRLRGKASQ